MLRKPASSITAEAGRSAGRSGHDMIDKGRLMPRHGFLLWAALFVLAWLGATYLVHFVLDRTYTVTHIFFQKQDCYVLTAAVPFLAFLAWPRFTARDLPGGPSDRKSTRLKSSH